MCIQHHANGQSITPVTHLALCHSFLFRYLYRYLTDEVDRLVHHIKVVVQGCEAHIYYPTVPRCETCSIYCELTRYINVNIESVKVEDGDE
jgi:hypothetical protein